jgi:cardiolipin synthase
MDHGSLLSLPNIVSLSRLVMAALFVMFPSPQPRLALIVAASITDYLDGWLARRANQITKWGALIDPIADRIFVFTAVCVFLLESAITSTQYFVLISRDLMTAIGFLVARSISWLRPIAFRARAAGKIVTALQLATLVALIVRPAIVDALVLLVGIASLIAVVDYTLMLWRERTRTAA